MDIWAWVFDLQRDLRAAGYDRVADLMDSIPSDATEDRPERVVAALPEAIAAARALKNSWLEVYFRHWGLGNRMNNLSEGEVALGEAADLLDFAHREETQSCPQSVCVTQDIAICYGNVDGPGWARERLQVCEETLARINPEWPCFTCISREYADALLDDKRPAEAIVFLDRQAKAILDSGDTLTSTYRGGQARALWLNGQVDEALAMLDAIDEDEKDGSDDRWQSRALLRAIIHAERGDLDAAKAALPSFGDLVPSSHMDWAMAARLMVKLAPDSNHWGLGNAMQKAMAHASTVGAHRKAVSLALWHAELALLRGAHRSARQALQVAQTHLARMRKPEDLRADVEALAAQIATLPAHAALPVPADELAAYLPTQENRSPEAEVDWLLTACAERPADPELAEFAANALHACGDQQAARDHLWQFVRRNPTVNGPNYQLLNQLMEHDLQDDVQSLADLLEAENPASAHWCRGRLAFRRQQWAQAIEQMQHYLQHDAEAIGPRSLWADAALALGQPQVAVEQRRILASRAEPGKNEDWDLLSTACAAQDWATARETAARLELNIDEGEGAIEENWGRCFIRFEENGESKQYYAYRTGPVTARIATLSIAPWQQRVRDWVAFDAALLEAPPEDEEERKEFIPTFRPIYTIETGGFGESCFVDGAAAPDEQFQAFVEALDGMGWEWWVNSPDDYTVTDPASEEPLPGRYFQVAAPRAVTPKQVDHTLRELTRDWAHPVCWPRYADRHGLPMAQHEDIVARYAL
ncbi:hypothetical protein [Leeia sp.]|uniref:hypothetical protein n=1 Tax=Leeia sp. TaxID=2884678 RepID=UPI0035B40195